MPKSPEGPKSEMLFGSYSVLLIIIYKIHCTQLADGYKHATICFAHETYTNLTQLSFGRQLRHNIAEDH